MSLSSAHFSSREIACHHCGKNECKQELLDALEQFRHEAGDRPVFIVSGYRCPTHNHAVGGAPRSEHMAGRAADIKIVGMTGAQLEAIARQCPTIKGIGRDDHRDYIHIDVREVPARWCYAPAGGPIPYYPANKDA